MKKMFGLFLIFLLPAMLVYGADQPAPQVTAQEQMSLNVLIQEALRNNPRIRAAKYRFEAAKARTALFRNVPDPMLEYEYDRITPSMSTAPGDKVEPMKTLGVSQEIPFPTKILLRKKVAQKEAKAIEEEYRETKQQVVKDVKEAYYKLFLDRQKIAYTKDNLNLMQELVSAVNSRYAVNKAGQQDVLRAQVEYSSMSNELLLFEQEAKIADSFLASLLGRDPEGNASIDLKEEEAKGLDLKEGDIVALVKANRPELKSYREMIGKAEAESSLSKQEFLPDITLKYKRVETDGSFKDGEWAGMVGVSVPLWFWGKQLPEVREAQANLAAAKADYAAEENTAVFEARSAFAKCEAARGLVLIYETGVLPQATAAVTTARRAYETSTLSFIEVLDSVRMLRDLQMKYFESVAELQVSLADLERAVGGDLEEQEKL